MCVHIEHQDPEFILKVGSPAVWLSFNSRLQLEAYHTRYAADDANLYAEFGAANNSAALFDPMTKLLRFYVRETNRNPRFRSRFLSGDMREKVAEKLTSLRENHEVEPTNHESIEQSINAVINYSSCLDLSGAQVVLSKLLHFINPKRFWIIDKRVFDVLRLANCSQDYQGFGKFLTKLVNDPCWLAFREFLQGVDGNNSGILKSIDKVLWS